MASVPLTVRAGDDPGTALLFVTASVDGVDQEFLLDTGAARSRIPSSARTRAWTVDGHEPDSSHVRVPAITLGTIEAREIVADLADDAAPAVLGTDVLTGHRIGVRLSAGRLQLDEQAAIDRWRPLNRSSRGQPLVEIEWDAMTAVAAWDTGASATVVDADLAASFPGVFAPSGAHGTDAHGHGTALVRAAPCRIGGRRFTASTAVALPLASRSRAGEDAFTVIIGYPLITQADWVFDFRAGMWGFLDRA